MVFLTVLAACGSPAGPEPADGAVLFIGNSLTATNDLPGLVTHLSRAIGAEIPTTAVIGAGVSLQDHWADGGALAEIGRGGWRAVVMQQGPSTLPASRKHLILWTGTFADAIRDAGSTPYLYMVWPPLSGDWDRGAESYRLAAESADAGLFPVAEAFRAAWRRDPDLQLLGPDDFHPSPLGTYLAAVVIVAQLEGVSPLGFPSAVEGQLAVDPAVATLLQQAAAEAIEAHAR